MGVSKPEISAIVVCYNEEDNIGDCLESLRWCDEIVVVDSFSTDRTVEICRQYTDRVIQRPWRGFGDQMAFAHSQATKAWVFRVDADERVSPELRQEMERALQQSDRTAAFAVPRVVWYLGRWWWRGGWYPDYSVRLFPRDRAVWAGVDPHPKVVPNGPVRKLENPLQHFSYRNIDDHIGRVNAYTTSASQELRDRGKRCRWSDLFFRPAMRFLYSYVWKRGFLEGFAGFFVAVTAAVYVFLRYAKLRELELKGQKEDGRGG